MRVLVSLRNHRMTNAAKSTRKTPPKHLPKVHIVRSWFVFCLVFIATLSFAPPSAANDPFLVSDEAMMARLVQQVPFGETLERFFAETSGKRLVFFNMEDDQATNDQLPEYLFLDAMFSRLTSANVKVRLLERDPDTLSLLEQELRGVALPHRKTPCTGGTGCDSEALSAAELEASRTNVAALLRGVLDDLAHQDVIVQKQGDCCGNDTLGSTAKTAVIANEIGDNKAALIRDLVEQYLTLNEASPAVVRNTRDVADDQADYLFAYRLYDFGWLKVKDRRIVYLKLHYRIVHLESGRVVVSGFLEDRLEDDGIDIGSVRTKGADYSRPTLRDKPSKKGLGMPIAAPAAPKLPTIPTRRYRQTTYPHEDCSGRQER